MKEINKKIIDYVVIGAMNIAMLGGAGYMIYDTIKNKTLTEKGFTAGCVALGAATVSTGYTFGRLLKEDYNIKKIIKKNEELVNKLEKDVEK